MKEHEVNGLYLMSSVSMPNGERVFRADSGATPPWYVDGDLHFANHNIFRIDANNQVVWQVRRVEDKFVNWEARHQHAKEADPNCEGYFDPFNHMSLRFFERRTLPYKGPFHPTEELVWFDEYAPGRLLSLATHWWAYDLDPVTGIATCTGEQVK